MYIILFYIHPLSWLQAKLRYGVLKRTKQVYNYHSGKILLSVPISFLAWYFLCLFSFCSGQNS